MPLQPIEQAFAEALLIEGHVSGPKLAFAIKLREAQTQRKPLASVSVELKLVGTEDAKRLWKTADAAIKAAPPAAFSFSEGAMMGPYELVEPRGSSLAGDHWRAKRPEGMGFLRLVPPGTGIDPDRAQRLIDRANAGVESPDETILRVDDAGEEFNWLYLGTLGFDGRSLASRLARGALPEAEAIVLAKTAARALSVAHGFGVVHGGLNPLAIVYGSDGTPKVTDFGVGSVFFDGPAAGMAPGVRLGLLLYAAPELIQGGAETGLDARADLYALGALLADAVSQPRAGDVRAPDTDPWLVQPAVSAGFVTILKRLLAFDPEERYPGADALLADLDKVAAGRMPGALPPAGPPVIVARPSTARPLQFVTAELLAGAEPPDSGLSSSAPPEEPQADAPPPPEPIAVEPPAADSEGIELAPPTIDPDADPAPALDDADLDAAEAALANAPPPTDDPDAAPRPIAPPKRKTKGLGRTSSEGRMRALGVSGATATEEPRASHGLGALVAALVVVGGGLVGAHVATRPEGPTLARYELGRAHLAAERDGDFKKAGDHLAKVRELGGGDGQLLDDARALELEIGRRRVRAYEAARRSKDASAAARAVEGSPLEALSTLDRLRRDAVNDGREWQKTGNALLAVGFPREAASALATATEKDPTCAKDKERAEAAEWLSVFVPKGKYAGAGIAVDQPLYVGAFEVTRGEYAKWLAESAKAQNPHASCHPKEPNGKSHAPDGWNPEAALAISDRRPATGIDAWDALAFARARGCRLPTHGELVAAAQGPTARPFPWGTRAFDAALANAGGTLEALVAVGSFPAGQSPLGAFDLVGNAEEWTAPESDDATEAKVFGSAYDTPADKLSLEEPARSAPLAERSAKRGFRCALVIEGTGAPK